MEILGISRSTRFSPNSAAKDAAIFDRVARVLTNGGHTVRTLSEEEFLLTKPVASKYIYTMARGEESLALLREMERGGACVINSAFGIDRCVRYPMSELFMRRGVPYPQSWLVTFRAVREGNCERLEVNAPDIGNARYPCWVKRGDACAQVKDDICFVETPEQMQRVLTDFCARSITSAVVNVHLPGDLVKFYSVANTDFFYWYYPSATGGKFGLEVINGASHGYPFDAHALKRCGDDAARLLDVPVYGGDCIVSADGSFRLIDFNDWPSFSACCDEAGAAIAECILRRFREVE